MNSVWEFTSGRCLSRLRAELDTWKARLDEGAVDREILLATLRRWGDDPTLRARRESASAGGPGPGAASWLEQWDELDGLRAALRE